LSTPSLRTAVFLPSLSILFFFSDVQRWQIFDSNLNVHKLKIINLYEHLLHIMENRERAILIYVWTVIYCN
jgi:hypothetical protein